MTADILGVLTRPFSTVLLPHDADTSIFPLYPTILLNACCKQVDLDDITTYDQFMSIFGVPAELQGLQELFVDECEIHSCYRVSPDALTTWIYEVTDSTLGWYARYVQRPPKEYDDALVYLMSEWTKRRTIDDGTAVAVMLMTRCISGKRSPGIPRQADFLEQLRQQLARPFKYPPERPLVPPSMFTTNPQDDKTYFADYIATKMSWLTDVFMTLFQCDVEAPIYVDVPEVYARISDTGAHVIRHAVINGRHVPMISTPHFAQGVTNKMLRRLAPL
jgi:hypothetical protein